MRIGNPKRDRGAGILEKLGIAALIGGFADLYAFHRAPYWADVASVVTGLTFVLLSVIITPDEP